MTDNTNAPKRRCIRPVGPNGIVNSWSNSDVNVYKTEHIWVINQYSFYDAKKEALKSSTFTSHFDGSTTCTWYLEINGEPNREDYISLVLLLDPTSECKSVYAKVRFSFMTSEQKEMHPNETRIQELHFNSDKGLKNSNSHGYLKFLQRNKLFNSEKKLLPNDVLTIFCKITYSKAIFATTSHQSKSITFHASDPYNRMSEDFGSLLKNGEFADVTILVNGTEYPAHKTILAARSTVFSAMLKQNGMQESEKNRIDITDISENVMVEVLRYMYTGNVENLEELADDLFNAADKYDLGELKALCENILSNNLSIDNAAKTLALADMHNANKLKTETMAYIVVKIKEVMDTEGWKIVESNLQLLIEVFQALADK